MKMRGHVNAVCSSALGLGLLLSSANESARIDNELYLSFVFHDSDQSEWQQQHWPSPKFAKNNFGVDCGDVIMSNSTVFDPKRYITGPGPAQNRSLL